ncbi:MAG: ArsR family transcriptional regulator [Bacteroidota bacterium]
MGAIKSNNYQNEELLISRLGRAISHPARVKILHKLRDENAGCRSVDLAKWLNFTKPTMKEHIDMMKDAGILTVEYLPHFYSISLNDSGKQFADKIFNEN